MKTKATTLIACLTAFSLLFCDCSKGAENEGNYPGKEKEEEKDPEPEPEPEPSLPDTVRILAIGNSFSSDAVEQELYPLLAAAGQKAIIGNLYIGGSPLTTHEARIKDQAASYSYRKIVDGVMTTTASVKISQGLADEKWDYVSVQEGAGWHGFYNETYKGFTHTMEPALTNVIDYVRNNTEKGCKIIYHVPWAAQTGYTGTKFSYYGYDQTVMYNMICSATKQVVAAHPEIDLVINTMDAIQNARTSYIGDKMNRDGWHLNYTTGRYTAGCIWAEKILGKSIVGSSYHPATMTAYAAEVCQNAAHEAVLHPYTVTDLSEFTAPADSSSIASKETLAKWYFTPERTVSDGGAMTWAGTNTLGTFRYSNEPGERGYFNANEEGNGKLSYVQIDKTSWSGDAAGLSILNVSNGGQPVMNGPMPGDYWLFETTGGTEFAEGTRLNIIYTYTASNYGAKYWMLEYLDGSEWKSVLDTLTTNIQTSGENISYNLELTKGTFKIVDVTVTLENPTKEFKFRQRCCSEYQVNDKWFEHPNKNSSQRIAGDPANEAKPLPVMSKVL